MGLGPLNIPSAPRVPLWCPAPRRAPVQAPEPQCGFSWPQARLAPRSASELVPQSKSSQPQPLHAPRGRTGHLRFQTRGRHAPVADWPGLGPLPAGAGSSGGELACLQGHQMPALGVTSDGRGPLAPQPGPRPSPLGGPRLSVSPTPAKLLMSL